jgi:DNA-binding CsgD family transcriptional regulator
MLPEDSSSEIFGCKETKKLFLMSNGKVISFKEINPLKRAIIFSRLLEDKKAMDDLKDESLSEAVQSFAFCLWGSATDRADFCSKGNLNEPENFLCSKNCRCIDWESKSIVINGNRLTPQEVRVLQLLASDDPDKAIAHKLQITESTLNTHKTHLFDKTGAASKTGLVMVAMTNNLIP